MKNRIVTISREFGSGGRTIGKKVAEVLGIPCYDAELIQKLSMESGFSESYIRKAGEDTAEGFLSFLFSDRTAGPTNEDILWNLQYKVITNLAQKGPCIIVGRCADYILRDTADCLKVFIHADLDFRGPGGSSRNTVSGQSPRSSACGRRTSGGLPITAFIPT